MQAEKGLIIAQRYTLIREIGSGGMGSVWIANQTSVKRTVAVKLLHHNLNKNKSLQSRFELEAQALARLNHPNCITLYDFGFSDELGAYYTVTEYIKGDSLDKLLDAPVNYEEAIDIVAQISDGLAHAHNMGIIHRDLKPENIMLSYEDNGTLRAKILDFGIARILSDHPTEQTEDRLTKAGEIFGTPPYMSPEQARAFDLTPASDLYALAIILYELIENRVPFIGEKAFDILMQHVSEPPPPMTADIPEALKALVNRQLQKEPETRITSAVEFGASLRSLLLPPATLTGPPSNEPLRIGTGEHLPTFETSRNDGNTSHSKITFFALFFLLMVGLSFFFITRKDGEEALQLQGNIEPSQKTTSTPLPLKSNQDVASKSLGTDVEDSDTQPSHASKGATESPRVNLEETKTEAAPTNTRTIEAQSSEAASLKPRKRKKIRASKLKQLKTAKPIPSTSPNEKETEDPSPKAPTKLSLDPPEPLKLSL